MEEEAKAPDHVGIEEKRETQNSISLNSKSSRAAFKMYQGFQIYRNSFNEDFNELPNLFFDCLF